MICPSCQRERPESEAVCPHCGGSPRLDRPSEPSESIGSSPLQRVFAIVGSLVCWVVIITLSYSVTRIAYGSFTAEAFGYFLGRCLASILMAALGVWFYYKRRRRSTTQEHKTLVVSAWAVVLAILATAGSVGSNTAQRHYLKARVGTLVKEAAGKLPTSPDQSKWDGVGRAFFADITAFNQDYAREAAALDNSALKEMYSPASFEDRGQIKRILAQLRATIALDTKFASLDPILEKMRARVQAVDATDSDKQAFWQGVESSAREILALRTDAAQKEQEWIQASIDLYEFTLANKSSFSIRNGKLIFKTDEMVAEFNTRMNKAVKLRSAFNVASENSRKNQKIKLGELGLEPSDVGNSSGEQPKTGR